MPNQVQELHGKRALVYAADGPLLRKGQDASDLISEARSADATIAVLPTARLDPAFFDLKTGIAGEMVQKFVNYGLKVALSATRRSLPRRARRCTISSTSRTGVDRCGFLRINRSSTSGSRAMRSRSRPDPHSIQRRLRNESMRRSSARRCA